ncbi:MAG: hypothetical protein AVDCRST_MAG85-1030 [uncultured Solirubrobacteraceae bacterium]|uniref:Uncharacterized protein n=1 Tax=uncultured Solirubrobacteraceae bacterium TaxID=1162706 RepID=A0A6J4S2X0_9ACTN|nr:MAG: hypothetical protein AVDCRST_MAG85-1030 [uncultured Solirubrobacteraceae bacterium]
MPGPGTAARTFAVLLLVALALPAGTTAISEEEAAAAKRKRCEVVVFKRKGKTIRRCRLIRKVRRPSNTPPALTPSLPAVPAPAGPAPEAGGAPQPTTPEPPHSEPPGTSDPQSEPTRDPWFLTMQARDVGNGDFRLLPQPRDDPGGHALPQLQERGRNRARPPAARTVTPA